VHGGHRSSRIRSGTRARAHDARALIRREREPGEVFLADRRGRGVAIQPGGNA